MGKLNAICDDAEILCDKGRELIEEHNAYLSGTEYELSLVEENIEAYKAGKEKDIYDGTYTLESFEYSCESLIRDIMFNHNKFKKEIQSVDEQICEYRDIIKNNFNRKKTMQSIDEFKDLLFDLKRYYQNIDKRIKNIIEKVNIDKSIYETVDSMVELFEEVEK